jgi:hypothetical protein
LHLDNSSYILSADKPGSTADLVLLVTVGVIS